MNIKKIGVLFVILALVTISSAFAQSYSYYISSGKFQADGWSMTCYSGSGQYRNDPGAISLKDQGPIPTGAYYITGVGSSKGVNTITLTPVNEGSMYGRYGFLIHGDNSSGTASTGCIVMGSSGREKIAADYKKGICPVLNVYR